jgi:hypothetical protein
MDRNETENCIILTWHIDDVREIRPDLNDAQCREVLRRCERDYDAEIGINWEVLQARAEECFTETEDSQLSLPALHPDDERSA